MATAVGIAIVEIHYMVDDTETDVDVERRIRADIDAHPSVLSVINLGGISTDPEVV